MSAVFIGAQLRKGTEDTLLYMLEGGCLVCELFPNKSARENTASEATQDPCPQAQGHLTGGCAGPGGRISGKGTQQSRRVPFPSSEMV